MMPKFIKKAGDLVTSREAVREGFLDQATQKGKAAAPYIKRAQLFKKALKKIKSIDEIAEKLADFKDELAAAAGLSAKGARHLTQQELESIVKASLKVAAVEKDFRQELVDRYLLTKGDALGGSMRNKIGSSAGEQLVARVVAALKQKKITPVIVRSKKNKIQSLQWDSRYLRFDHKPKLIEKNIDAILINTHGLREVTKDALNEADRYIAAGELKGGIDPAGADEHWKTAKSALDRIRSKFTKKPALFFVGAAIESAMAVEIFDQLKNKELTYAANLNSQEQIDDLAHWLVNL